MFSLVEKCRREGRASTSVTANLQFLQTIVIVDQAMYGKRCKAGACHIHCVILWDNMGYVWCQTFLSKTPLAEHRRRTHLLGTYYVTGTGATEVRVTVVGRCRGFVKTGKGTKE